MTLLRYGYISNGFADHSLEQMVQVLEHFGYPGIGITLDHQHLDPFQVSRPRLREIAGMLERAQLQPVIETGARYYLDAFRKHRPSMVSIDAEARRQRVAYYLRAIDIAGELGAPCVSLWSGRPQDGQPEEASWSRLLECLDHVCQHGESRGVRVAFEPEPGMFVADLAGYDELKRRCPHPSLGLTLDLGHLAITESLPLEQHIHRLGADLLNVHIEDIKDREHVHLPLGQGDMDFPPLLEALVKLDYKGLVLVELSRHSADAPRQAQASILFLRSLKPARD